MSDIKSPRESLACYFDELLAEPEPWPATPLLVEHKPQRQPLAVVEPQMPNGVEARVPTVVEMQVSTVVEMQVQTVVEPLVPKVADHTQRLEKLLQSAHHQLWQMPQAKTLPSKTVPPEIQTWEITAPSTLQENPQVPALPVERVPVSAPVPAASIDTPEPLPENSALGVVDWLENGRPAWAQARFDVLLFGVSGLTLAVPLVALGQIQPLTDELTPLFGQADWFMGLQPTPAGKIRTVNTARFVMPERYDERFVQTARYVVSINGVPWGLAVDSVNQPISLAPEDVKWRGDRSKRPWLAGTVKEHMCALLDIPRIGQLLLDADKNHRPLNG